MEGAIMADENRGDDNHASLGLRFRRMLARSANFTVAIGVCLVLYVLVAGRGSLGRLFLAVGMPPGPHAYIGKILLPALMIFALIVRMSCNNLNAWSNESEEDSFHRRHNATVLLILLCGGYMLVPYLVEKDGIVPPFRDFFLVPVFLIALAHEIVFGPITFFTSKADAAVAREISEDEFFRAMRAKASKVGYAVVMLAGSFALLLLHNNLAQEPAVMFAVLYAGVAGSLLYYDYLIWRADRAH
jgi:hypothetical protein